MGSVARQKLLSSSLISRSHIFHNGKGRPELLFRQLPSRFMSTGSRSYILPSKRPLALRSAILPPTTIRFLSTTSTKDPLLQKTTSSQPEGTNFGSDTAELNAWDPNFNDAILPDKLASIEPHIGYLKELGLDFGWGPTSILQWLVEHLYVDGGLPWYGTFIASAVLIRILLIPLFLRGADASGRMISIQHVLQPLKDKMMAARRDNDTTSMMVAYKEITQIERRAGIKKRRTFLPVLIQAPLAFGAFRLARNMADLPVPGLETGGALWFMDLTVRDPYFIIPALTSGFLYLGMRKGGDLGVATAEQQKIMSSLKIFFPILSLVFTSFLPAAVTLQFCITSLLSVGQTYILASNRAREILGVHPINRYTPPDKYNAYKGTITRHVDTTANDPPKPKPSAFAQYKKQAEDWMAKRSGDQGKRLTKSEKAKATAYEKRRREELEEELFQRRQQLKKREQQQAGEKDE